MAITIKEKIAAIFKFNFKTFSALISQIHSGYLIDTGWFYSFNLNESVDKNKNPIPWATYPFIDFIRDRLNKRIKLFEFGSGNSTLFYANLVDKVFAVEHNIEWFNKIKTLIPENVELIKKEFINDGQYSKAVAELNQHFQIVIIDGLDRNNCIITSLSCLSEDGVIILDDSERNEYKEGSNYLLENGFKKIDFWGIAPCVLFKKCTSIYYKKNNCLGI